MAHTALGQELLFKFAKECEESAIVARAPNLEGRQMLLFLAPKPVKTEKAEKAPKTEKPKEEAKPQEGQ